MEEEKTRRKKNNLNTKNIPPLLMLVAGLIALIIGIKFSYSTKNLLIIVFLSMLVFAIIGTIVKSIVDQFDMKIDYDDLLDLEDEGEE